MREERKGKTRVTQGVQARAQVHSAIRSRRRRGLRTPSVPHCAMRAGRQGRTPRGSRACQTPQCSPAQGTPDWGEKGSPSVSPNHRTCMCVYAGSEELTHAAQPRPSPSRHLGTLPGTATVPLPRDPSLLWEKSQANFVPCRPGGRGSAAGQPYLRRRPLRTR